MHVRCGLIFSHLTSYNNKLKLQECRQKVFLPPPFDSDLDKYQSNYKTHIQFSLFFFFNKKIAQLG